MPDVSGEQRRAQPDCGRRARGQIGPDGDDFRHAVNAYKKAVQFNDTVDGTTVAIFYAENIAAGANTVTVSDSISGGTLRFAILEYAGVATVNSLDVTAAATGNSVSPNSGTATTTVAETW